MRITLDTNTLVGGYDPSSGDARRLLAAILRGGHTLVLSQSILLELEEVLEYPRLQGLYGLGRDEVKRYVALLIRASELVDLGPPIELPFTDLDDWAVLRTAIAGAAEVVCSSDNGFHRDEVRRFVRSTPYGSCVPANCWVTSSR